MTADGRVADIGTDAELTERCELYRVLITGPGDDVEGIDAGELPAGTASALTQPRRRSHRARLHRRQRPWERKGEVHASVRYPRFPSGRRRERSLPPPPARAAGWRAVGGRGGARGRGAGGAAAPWTA